MKSKLGKVGTLVVNSSVKKLIDLDLEGIWIITVPEIKCINA